MQPDRIYLNLGHVLQAVIAESTTTSHWQNIILTIQYKMKQIKQAYSLLIFELHDFWNILSAGRALITVDGPGRQKEKHLCVGPSRNLTGRAGKYRPVQTSTGEAPRLSLYSNP